MTYRPISCLENPVAARWGPYDEDDDDRRDRVAEERATERLYEVAAERGLNRPLFETAADQNAFLAELRVGVRGG